jgi:hypothetical protein
MEVPQGNSPSSYLKQTKMSFFLLLLLLYKIGEYEGRTGGWYQWEEGGRREMAWDGEYGANTVYTCM